jgi:hypothetical protein
VDEEEGWVGGGAVEAVEDLKGGVRAEVWHVVLVLRVIVYGL